MKYLQDKGYGVVPVNPGIAGETRLGRPDGCSSFGARIV
jgi:predicted CoA-binding protein